MTAAAGYYPFATRSPYARNHWYVIATAAEIDAGIVERTCLGETMALYRGESGAPVALASLCPHRRLPLARGRRVGDSLRCGYHGATFDASGACTYLPMQERIPRDVRVRSYPAVQQWQWVWVWPGDPSLADPKQIPSAVETGLEQSGFDANLGDYLSIAGRYQLLNENLLDLSHLGELHAGSLGTPGVLAAKIRTAFERDVIRVSREVPDDAMNGFYREAFGVQSAVMNRKQTAVFYPPCFHVTELRVTIPDDASGRVYAHNVIHAITPETPYRTHYWWAIARNYRRGDAEVTRALRLAVNTVFAQDREAIEAIECTLTPETTSAGEATFVTDTGALRGRKIIRDWIMDEERARETNLLM